LCRQKRPSPSCRSQTIQNYPGLSRSCWPQRNQNCLLGWHFHPKNQNCRCLGWHFRPRSPNCRCLNSQSCLLSYRSRFRYYPHLGDYSLQEAKLWLLLKLIFSSYVFLPFFKVPRNVRSIS
jgi:hypothetical protein